MGATSKRMRHGLVAAFAVSAVGGVVGLGLAAPGAPSAGAAPDPCAASEVAKAVGSVAVATGSYLDAHPQTNLALTAISQQNPGPQSLAALKSYFDANPQAAKDMQQLQAPLVGLSSRCQLPLTLPQLLGLVQGAQSQVGALPTAGRASGLPGMSQAVPGTSQPTAGYPAQSGAPAATSQGAGPLPGPGALSAG